MKNMLCPVCGDIVEKGKCTFCGHVVTEDEMPNIKYGNPYSNVTINESKNKTNISMNECKNHDEHVINTNDNLGNYSINECKDHTEHSINTSKTEQVDFFGVTSILESAEKFKEKIDADAKDNSEHLYTSGVETEDPKQKTLDCIFIISIIAFFVNSVFSIILSIVGYSLSSSEANKKKFKKELIILIAIGVITLLIVIFGVIAAQFL